MTINLGSCVSPANLKWFAGPIAFPHDTPLMRVGSVDDN
jgi:hypothetical protein